MSVPIWEDITLEQLLERKGRVNVITGCWLANGYLDKDGYGVVVIRSQSYRLARAALMIKLKRELQMLACHLPNCTSKACFNPDHLYEGSVTDNNNDTVETKRHKGWGDFQSAKTHCPKGHPYNLTNTYFNRGERYCKQCRRENKEKSKQANQPTTNQQQRKTDNE